VPNRHILGESLWSYFSNFRFRHLETGSRIRRDQLGTRTSPLLVINGTASSLLRQSDFRGRPESAHFAALAGFEP
jgi:hypothetical protein